MWKRWLRRVSVGLSLWVSLLPAWGAPPPVPADERLPGDTVACLIIRDAPDFFSRIQNLQLARFPEQPGAPAWIEATGLTTAEVWRHDVSMSVGQLFFPGIRDEESLRQLGASLQGEVSLALLLHPRDGLGFVLQLELGEHLPTVRNQLGRWIQSEKDSAEPLKPTLHSHADVGDYQLFHPASQSRLLPAVYCTTGQSLIIASSESILNIVLERWRGSRADTLRHDPAYQAVLTHAEGSPGTTDLPEIVWFERSRPLRDLMPSWETEPTDADAARAEEQTSLAIGIWSSWLCIAQFLGLDATPFRNLDATLQGGMIRLPADDREFVSRIVVLTDVLDSPVVPPANEVSPPRTFRPQPASIPSAPPAWMRRDTRRLRTWQCNLEQLTTCEEVVPFARQFAPDLAMAGVRLMQQLLQGPATDGDSPFNGRIWMLEYPTGDWTDNPGPRHATVLAIELDNEAEVTRRLQQRRTARVAFPQSGPPIDTTVWYIEVPAPDEDDGPTRVDSKPPAEPAPSDGALSPPFEPVFACLAHRCLLVAFDTQPLEFARLALHRGSPLADEPPVVRAFRQIPADVGSVTFTLCPPEQFRAAVKRRARGKSVRDIQNWLEAHRPELPNLVRYFPPVATYSEPVPGGERVTAFQLRESDLP